MSFRYTNNLVGIMKHRLMLESSHRELVRRRFAGHCRGVEVVCSGYGTVLAVRLVDKAKWEPFYHKSLSSEVNGVDTSVGIQRKEEEVKASLDLEKLSESIKAAVWDAIRKIRATKEAALHRSLHHNQQLQSQAELKHWYEEDANTLRPLAFEALKHEAATPWMQLVQFGKLCRASLLLQQETSRRGSLSEVANETAVTARNESNAEEREDVYVTALKAEDTHHAAIPFASVHPLFVPALIQFENSTQGGINEETVRQEQWRELSRDEQFFWERVDLIRKVQLATIKDGQKRNYADEVAVTEESAEDKIQLRFTQ